MKSFHNFTEGTAKIYEFEDKLHYLDNLRKSLHAGSTDEHVRRLVCKRVEHRMEEEGDFPDRKDFLCIEFMEHCFDEGFMPFHDTYYFGSKSGNEECLRSILRIIRTVVNYSEEEYEKLLEEE